jgi:hypothetical protein
MGLESTSTSVMRKVLLHLSWGSLGIIRARQICYEKLYA